MGGTHRGWNGNTASCPPCMQAETRLRPCGFCGEWETDLLERNLDERSIQMSVSVNALYGKLEFAAILFEEYA